MIARFSDALFPVLDAFRRTVRDARHAVRAIFSPYRPAVFLTDIVQRTKLHASAAACTPVSRCKSARLYTERIKHPVHRSAHHAIEKIISRFCKFLRCGYPGDHVIYVGFRIRDDLQQLPHCPVQETSRYSSPA